MSATVGILVAVLACPCSWIVISVSVAADIGMVDVW